MPTRTDQINDMLAALFPSRAMARLVIFFFVHSTERIHLRELRRRTALPSASLQRELRRLAGIGALRREDEGGRAYFFADRLHPAWRAWALLLRSAAAPEEVLREALAVAPGLIAAFIYGSSAHGGRDSRSDIDLFLLVEDPQAIGGVRERLSEVEFLLERPLDVVEYTPDLMRARLQGGNRFLQHVLAGPKLWIVGEPDAVPLPATA
jgi:predicted nucleotidyltransferase